MSALFRVDPYGPYASELAEIRRRLTPQQALFIEELLVDLDHERAASSVGLPPKKGKSLAKQYYVRRALELVMAERAARLHVTQDKVVEEYAKLAFANMADYMQTTPDGDPHFDLSRLDRDQKAALSEVTIEDYVDGRGRDAREVKRIKFKLHDKKAALDSLGRHLGMFVDRTEVTGKMDVRLSQMTRAERLQMMQELLAPMQKYLELESRTVANDGKD
jgi:phage terminase small subunit